MATIDDFKKIEIRVGRITAVDDFPEARNPSYKLTIDFGPFGTRRSSAAVRSWYEKSDLLGRLVVCVTNFPPKRIAGFISEVLTTGFILGDGGVVLSQPERVVPNGTKLA